jgi:excisionase family DNA binding protein
MQQEHIVPHRPLAVSPAEAAKMLGLGKTKLYELIAANELASVKIGARRLIRVSAIEDFLNRLAAEGDG